MRIHLFADNTPQAEGAAKNLLNAFETFSFEDADTILALGGDGFLLRVLQKCLGRDKKIFGMNLGTMGFLMNPFSEEHVKARLENAIPLTLHPLKASIDTTDGQTHTCYAINEVYVYRQTHQSAHLRIHVNEKVQLEELVCDGALVSSPAGSTAYNYSAHGPILPIESNLLALTPISPFRPRRWRGAVLMREDRVVFETQSPDKRPISAVADNHEVRHAQRVEIQVAMDKAFTLLFDPENDLSQKVRIEQFSA